jgi:mono/diheme cytochrome c family protein
MKRFIPVAVLTLCLSCVAWAASPASTVAPTFSKDVAAIFYKNCVDCHRPGEAAPMSLLNYKDARPWIKSIREKVTEHVMPPWQADPHFGKFSNDRRLQQKDIDTIVAWIDAGAKEGDAKYLPKQPEYPDGWSIGKPDAIFSMPEEFNVPAEGVVEYQHWVVPSNFTEDKWVTAAEIKMGNRAVIHHAIVFIYDPKTGPSLPDGLRQNLGKLPQMPRDPSRARVQQKLGSLLIGSGPGDQAMYMKPGHGMLIKAGMEFIFQIHYTPNGHATTDRTRVGFKFATEPPKFEDRNVGVLNGRFVIPAYEANYMVESSATFTEDALITSLFPHMHVRGKSFEFRLVTPDGQSQILLEVPKYDFNWQAGYNLATPLLAPKGSRIECTAYFDNSKGNKFNPDPSKEVTWGDQTWEEMMIGFTTIALPNKRVATSVEGGSR